VTFGVARDGAGCPWRPTLQGCKGFELRQQPQGLPEFRRQTRGNLYLRVRMHVPEQLSTEEHQLYERLQALRSKPK
jgi:DnaJ-class molecular chaperone